MSDRRECVKCGRTIDRYARICPYCNWDQNEPLPASAAARLVGALPAYQPPSETRWRKPVFGLIGGVLGVFVAFFIGIHVHGRKPPETIPPAVSAVQEAPRPHANVMLVPDTSAAPTGEAPITSAPVTTPAQGVPNELQRTDATAASSDEYALMAQRAKAEKKRIAALVDPRAITGSAYGDTDTRPAPRPARAAAPAPRVAATQPVPESQPLPRIRLRGSGVARFALTVGADGRVHDVNVQQGLGDQTAPLIAAVQRWRFRPATLNGVPVAAPFTVELSFHADE